MKKRKVHYKCMSLRKSARVEAVASTTDLNLLIVAVLLYRREDTEVDQLRGTPLHLLNNLQKRKNPTLELLKKLSNKSKWLPTSRPHRYKLSSIRNN
jgi:hypothetical protein